MSGRYCRCCRASPNDTDDQQRVALAPFVGQPGNEERTVTVKDPPTETTEGKALMLTSLATGLSNNGVPPITVRLQLPDATGQDSNPSFNKQLPGTLGSVPRRQCEGNGARLLATTATRDAADAALKPITTTSASAPQNEQSNLRPAPDGTATGEVYRRCPPNEPSQRCFSTPKPTTRP